MRAADTGPDANPPTLGGADTRFFVAPMLGFASDDLNVGLGLRAGKTLENRLYLGGSLTYHFGQSVSASTTAGGQTYSSSASTSVFYIGPEVGYDFVVGPVVLRPYAGLGLAMLSVSASGEGATVGSSETKLVIWPGGAIIFDMPASPFFVGGDLRLVSVPSGPSFGLFAFGGMRFGS